MHGSPTNPSGYLRLFEKRSTLLPTMRVLKSSTVMESRGTIDPFPEHFGFKGILRRIVQMVKRHRTSTSRTLTIRSNLSQSS